MIQGIELVTKRDYMDDFKNNNYNINDTMKKQHKNWSNHSDINNKCIDKRNDKFFTKNNDIKTGDRIKKDRCIGIYIIKHTNVVSIINNNRSVINDSNLTHRFDNKINKTSKEKKYPRRIILKIQLKKFILYII